MMRYSPSPALNRRAALPAAAAQTLYHRPHRHAVPANRPAHPRQLEVGRLTALGKGGSRRASSATVTEHSIGGCNSGPAVPGPSVGCSATPTSSRDDTREGEPYAGPLLAPSTRVTVGQELLRSEGVEEVERSWLRRLVAATRGGGGVGAAATADGHVAAALQSVDDALASFEEAKDAVGERVDEAVSSVDERTKGLVLLNLLTLLMATNWIVVKQSEGTLDPCTFATLRFACASLAFLPQIWDTVKNSGRPMERAILLAGMELGTFAALGYDFQAVGLQLTDASRASFLSTFTVLLVPMFAGLSGRGIAPRVWAAAIFALVGVGFLEQGGSGFSMGDVYSLISAAFFAAQIFRTEHYAREIPKSKVYNMIGIQVLMCSLISGLAVVAQHPNELVDAAAHVFASPASLLALPLQAIAYTGLLSTDLVLLMELVALGGGAVSSVDAAITYTLEPVLGAGFAWWLLGERWGANGWTGAALIVLASLAVQLGGEDDEEGEGTGEEATRS